MNEDPEVAAMSSVAGALTNLDDEARMRVIEWAAKRYRSTAPGSLGHPVRE